jgi:hypothetical protein
MRIGPRFKIPCKPLTIQDKFVHWVDNINYLGVTISQSKSLRCLWNEAKGKFYMCVNTILGRLGTNAPVDVLLKLIQSQGVPSLLYGTAAVALNKSELSSLCNAYNNMFGKIFHSYDKNVIAYCQWYSGFWPFELVYEYHRYNFLNTLAQSQCIDKTLDVDCPDYIEYENIQKKYAIEIGDSLATVRYKFWKFFESLLQ